MTLGRPREFERDEALDAAVLLFWRKGFAATSISDLRGATGIGATSLYAAFGSKEALYREALTRYVDTLGSRMWNELPADTARAGVRNLLMVAANECLPGSATTPAGCMAMLGAVGDEWPMSVTEKVKQVRSDTLRRFRARLETAVADGELSPSTDIDGLSRFYLGVLQGMAVQARDGAKASDLKAIAERAMAAWPRQPGP